MKRSLKQGSEFIIVLILVALFGLGLFLFQSSKRGSKDDITTEEEDLVSKGIHPDPVEIKILEGVTAIWQDDKVAYTLENVYLTPDIANMGNFRNNVGIRGKSFFVAEIDVRDRRTSGERRKIPVHNYLRLRDGRSDAAPLSNDRLFLSPQENGVAFVVFPVERDLLDFELLIGNLASPRVIDLDFENPSLQIKEGVFLLRKGYLPAYPSDFD